jgi:carboxylate-amine ligase
MEFSPCTAPTVGVEWELQLLDDETLDLYDGIMPLMEFFPRTPLVKPEYIQSCVELTSGISATSDAAVSDVAKTLCKVLPRCRELGMRACGAGTHAFGRRLALITPSRRYSKMQAAAGHLAFTQITFSAHVHIGMRSGDEAMRAMALLIPALPAFIAISANSPFWRGYQTGHAAYRHRILAAAPNYGLPTAFETWSDFEKFYRAALRAGMIRHFKDIHWDIRPHPDFGTLEIRAMDSASDLSSLHALIAFARVLTVAMARSEREQLQQVMPLELPVWIERENCYRASHLGLDADIIINHCGDRRPLRDLIDDLLSFCDPVAHDIGESAGIGVAREMLAGRSGYVRQLEAYASSQSARAVVEDLSRRLQFSTAAVRAETR